jgi:WD40 repeat protein
MLWDVDTGKLTHSFLGHTGPVNSVAFSPDGRILVSASSDNTLILWHIESKQKIHTLIGHKGPVNDAVFSSNGKFIASASDDKTLQLWDPTTGEMKSTFAEFLPGDEETFVVLGMNSKQTIKEHFDGVTSVAISPDSKLIASASKDETIKLWDASTGKLVKNFVGHKGYVNSLAFNTSGDTLVSGSDDKAIMMWDVNGTNENVVKGIFTGHSEKINSVFYSANNQTIVSGSNDNTIKLWDVADKTSFNYNLLCEEQEDAEFQILDINPEHTEAVGLCMDGWLYFVDLKSGQIKRQFLSENIEDAIYSPNGKSIFFVLNKRGVFFDIKTASLNKLIKFKEGIYSIAFHPNGRYIVTGHKTGYIKYWNIVTGELFRSQKVSKNSVEGIKFSPDADKIAITTTNRYSDSLLVMVDANLNKVTQSYEFNGGDVDFSPDSKLIAFASPDNIINLRDVVSGKLEHHFNEYLTSLSYVSSIGFSLDGKTLVSSSFGGGLSLWSIGTGQFGKWTIETLAGECRYDFLR